MTNLRQAAQRALKAMEDGEDRADMIEFSDALIALRAALAEPEEYAAQNPLGGPAKVFDAMADAIRAGDDYHATLRRYGFAEVKALAEPEQEPVAWSYELATTKSEQGYGDWSHRRITQHKPNVPKGSIRNLTPLYTAPTPRKPLSEDEIVRLMVGEDRARLLSVGEFAEGAIRELVESARAIERAHGIGEQT